MHSSFHQITEAIASMGDGKLEIIIGKTNSGWFYFEIIDGDRLLARVVNFDTPDLARKAAEERVKALAA